MVCFSFSHRTPTIFTILFASSKLVIVLLGYTSTLYIDYTLVGFAKNSFFSTTKFVVKMLLPLIYTVIQIWLKNKKN